MSDYVRVLDDAAIDDRARQSLFLLASYGNDGKLAANHVLAKLVKGLTDDKQMKNPSAWVHSTVMKSRYRL